VVEEEVMEVAEGTMVAEVTMAVVAVTMVAEDNQENNTIPIPIQMNDFIIIKTDHRRPYSFLHTKQLIDHFDSSIRRQSPFKAVMCAMKSDILSFWETSVSQ
jgi:type I site-specific restriction endonuclease